MSSNNFLTQFEENGYCVLEDFASADEVQAMKDGCWRVVEEMDPAQHRMSIFSTGTQKHCNDRYFIDSVDKVSFFFEEGATDEKGALKVNKHLALNKIGHALHWLVPEFKKFTFSQKMKKVVRQLGFKSPTVVQSMYIFKQPLFGGEVTPHKDATFLSSTPQTCIGFWLALEDAALENGCLWFSPGSHKVATNRRFIRNHDKNGPLTLFNGPEDQDDPSLYIPVEVKKGSLVILNGQVDHKSYKNLSKHSRNIYTFHVIDKKDAIWSPQNWIQPTETLPFYNMYDTCDE